MALEEMERRETESEVKENGLHKRSISRSSKVQSLLVFLVVCVLVYIIVYGSKH